MNRQRAGVSKSKSTERRTIEGSNLIVFLRTGERDRTRKRRAGFCTRPRWLVYVQSVLVHRAFTRTKKTNVLPAGFENY